MSKQEMSIIVNEAGRKGVEGLCDAALRVGGIQNFNHISQILGSIQMIEPKPVEGDDRGKDSETNSGGEGTHNPETEEEVSPDV